MVFHWSLSDSKSPHVYRIFLNILANLKYAVVRIASIHRLIFKSSSPRTSPLVTVPSVLLLLQLLLLLIPLEFFTSVLADGFSLEFEWLQVSFSSL